MPKPATKPLSVDSLVLDAGTQSRVSISEETVEDYAEVIESNGLEWPFPPIVVFHDLKQYLVADGFHRVLAAVRAKRSSIPCEVRKGTAQDALRFGMTANDTHGLRRSRADKRHCVELLLDGDENLTRQEVADIAGVTKRTVQRIVSERAEVGVTLSPTRGQSGENGECDPFIDESDPFGELEGEHDLGLGSRTDPAGRDAFEEPPPRPPGNGREAPGGVEKTPAELFQIQRAKTVKTVEALMRAFDDLKALRYSKQHSPAIADCKALLQRAKTW